jgi:hypothetical protein
VDAIYAERDVPDNMSEWTALNAAEAAKHPVITGVHEPLKGPKCVDPNAG